MLRDAHMSAPRDRDRVSESERERETRMESLSSLLECNRVQAKPTELGKNANAQWKTCNWQLAAPSIHT